MSALRRNVRLYRRYVSIIWQSTMQYKLSFVLMMVGRFILAFNSFVALHFLFSGFTQIKGYTYGEILLCFSVVYMSFSLAECFGSGFHSFSGVVRRGEFDGMLLRPCSPVLQVIGTKFEVGRLGTMVTAVITLVLGIRESQIVWGIGKIVVLVGMILGGTIVFIALFMLGASLCFFSIADGGFINILTYGAKEHGKYPVDIYGEGLMSFCTYIIPYALFQYYPLQYLLGKSNRWQYGLYPVGTVFFLILCYLVWVLGMRRYKSTGN